MQPETYFILAVSGVLGLVVFYYIIKSAVKNGIIAAREKPPVVAGKPTKIFSQEDIAAQKKREAAALKQYKR